MQPRNSVKGTKENKAEPVTTTNMPFHRGAAPHLLGQVLQGAAAEGRLQRGARHLRAEVVVVLLRPVADQLIRRRLRLPAPRARSAENTENTVMLDT